MTRSDYFKEFIEQLDEVFFVMEYPSLAHLYISPSVEKIRGYTPEEVYANPGIMYQHNTPEQTAYMMNLFQENIGKPPFFTEQPLHDKQGVLKWFSCSMMMLTTKEGKQLLVGLSRDISDRKNAEFELEKLRQEYEDLYNNAPNGYHSLNVNGELVRINDTELKLLGYKREELLGKRVFDTVFTRESKQQDMSEFAQLWGLDQIKDHRLNLLRKDGSTLPVLLNATLVKNEKNEPIYSRSILTDISELVKTEDELRRSQLAMEAINKALKQTNKKLERLNFTKDVLLKIISHDLRNPLETIKLVSNLLNEKYEELDTETVLKHLEYINETSNHATNILDDLAGMIKMGDKIASQFKVTDLGFIVETSIGNNIGQAGRKGIQIVWEKAVAPKKIKAKVGAQWLVRALDNLINNAIKFSKIGSTVSISCIQEGRKAVIKIADNGWGISSEMLTKTFTRYPNKNRQGTAGELGTGVGLSIVKQIIDMMHGEISVTSTEDVGSIFEIRFNAIE